MKRINITTRVEHWIFTGTNTVFMIALSVVMLYPFLNQIAVSFNDALDSVRGGIFVWPRLFSLNNYKAVLTSMTIYQAFGISVARTVLVTILQIFFSSMLAYALSRKGYVFGKLITIAVVLTMYFNAGLIPVYYLFKGLGLYNNFLVYIVPAFIGAFNFMVVRTYIRTLPESLIESAKMDGAGEFRIFMQIILPLCKPVLATIAIMIAVYQWNSWFDSYIFTTDQYLSTLQYELQKLVASANIGQSNSAILANALASGGEAVKNIITPASMRAAVTVITAVPIIIVYPFLQRYFITGLTLGSVKE